jgi:hypothetical protein
MVVFFGFFGFQAASLFTVLWLTSFTVYLVGATAPAGFEWLSSFPYQLHPLLLLLLFTAVLIRFQFVSNAWLLRTLFNIVTAPLYPLQFRFVTNIRSDTTKMKMMPQLLPCTVLSDLAFLGISI